MPRQCFRKRFSAGQSSARPAPLTLITATSKRMFQAGTYHGFSRSAGSTTFRVYGKSPAAGLVRVQAGDAVPVTQASKNNSSLGVAVQRPNGGRNPNDFVGSSRAKFFTHAALAAGP